MNGGMTSIGVVDDSNLSSGGGTGSGTTNLVPTVIASAKLVSTNMYQITSTGSDIDGNIAMYEYLNGTTLITSGPTLQSIQLAVTQNTTLTVRVKDNS